MQEHAPQEPRSPPFNEGERSKMKQALDGLKIENSQLRQLVVRLSETIIKNIIARR